MGDNWELKQKVDEIHILLERCDAYETRIAELEADAIRDAGIECDLKTNVHQLRAELARVKAESLRVVECDTDAHYALYIDESQAFLRPLGMMCFPIKPDGIPVRLERWETEE